MSSAISFDVGSFKSPADRQRKLAYYNEMLKLRGSINTKLQTLDLVNQLGDEQADEIVRSYLIHILKPQIRKEMPYKIVQHGRCWSVVNGLTGRIYSHCSTKAHAQAQLRLLRGVEHGMVVRKRR